MRLNELFIRAEERERAPCRVAVVAVVAVVAGGDGFGGYLPHSWDVRGVAPGCLIYPVVTAGHRRAIERTID